jgi:hypothetical protein
MSGIHPDDSILGVRARDRRLAAANPDRMVFLDLSPAFRRLGVPGTDIYHLMNADLVHLGDEGHAFLGELVYDALFQQLSVSKAAVALPVPGFPTNTSTALALSPSAPSAVSTTTLTATVTPTAAGSVEFFDGATSRGVVAVRRCCQRGNACPCSGRSLVYR